MYPKLLHIYGPLYINSYGVAIALGLLLFIWRATKDSHLKKLLSIPQLHTGVILGLFSGLLGGRILYLATNWYELTTWYDIFALWNGGLSITGVIIGALTSSMIYLWWHAIPFFLVIDRFAIYAPLAQSIGRIGCFMAGCCHGTIATTPWSITYTNVDSFAPLHLALHPTQLYSTGALLLIFLFLHHIGQTKQTHKGTLTMLYLMLVSAQRFLIDFWRGDRIFFETNALELSVHQWLSGGIVIGACIGYILLRRTRTSNSLTTISNKFKSAHQDLEQNALSNQTSSGHSKYPIHQQTKSSNIAGQQK